MQKNNYYFPATHFREVLNYAQARGAAAAAAALGLKFRS